jgi:hypothetical protein
VFAMKFRRSQSPEEQAAPREKFSLVTMLRAAGTTATVLVHDISATGFEAECLAKFRSDAKVRINLPGLGDVDARIVSARRDVVVGRFLRPIDLAQCVAAANWPNFDFNQAAPVLARDLKLV